MDENQDDDHWPSYNVGESKHLHALGVISVCYASFARGMDDLYSYHAASLTLPKELSDLYYFSLNEERRLAAIQILAAADSDDKLRHVIQNIVQYFNWARDTRNKLLHAEQYPASLFTRDTNLMHLTKREGKQNPKPIYMALSLKHLRNIANQIQEGLWQCASIRIFLRVRNVPGGKLPVSLKMFAHQSLPEILHVPRRLRISPTPRSDPIPPHLRKSFDQ